MYRFLKAQSASLTVGIMLAAVGFSYALATNSAPDAEAGARSTPRVAGSNPRQVLDFTVPFLGGDRDLGDAAIGSTLTRYIQARGGIPPHRFTSDRTLIGDDGQPVFQGTTTLGEAEIALPVSAKPTQSTAAVFLNGLLKGVVGGPGGTVADGTPLRFDVTVADSRNTPNTKTDKFRLTLVDPNTFKFAQSALNTGVAFRRYYEKLEVIAGNGKYKFSASNITVTNAGVSTPVAKFEDIGLFLNKNTGHLVGRPLMAGTVSFLADCVDAAGAHAAGRNKTGVGQVINFNVLPSNRVASELFALKMSIKGDTKTGGKDTISYQGILALGNNKLADLDGLGVSLMIGDYVSPTATLSGGKGTSGNLSVAITSDGALKISIKNESFGSAGSIITNSELSQSVPKILPVSVTIDSPTDDSKPAYQSSELLRFSVKAKSSKFDLEYKFGPGNLGGGFIITQVAGKDDKAETGDAWAVKYVALPPNAKKLASFGTIVATTVGIGTDFTDSIPSALVKDTVTSTEKRTSGATILKTSFNSASGKGFVLTGTLPFQSALPNTQTNIKPALNANGKRSPFPFLITFVDANGNELFGAEGSRRINPKGTSWVSKDLGK